MKKSIMIPTAIAVLMSVAVSFGHFAKTDDGLSDLQLANAEALADDDEYSGKPCYNEGKYDYNWPDALVCGTPCQMQPWNPPMWGGVSHCQ